MTSSENHQTDVSPPGRCYWVRWDDEGGASMSARSNTGVRVSKGVRSKRMVEATADPKVDQAPAAEERKFWNVWERPSSCDGALFRPKSSGNSSNTRRSPPTSRRQPRRRDSSRASCILITRMTGARTTGGPCRAVFCDVDPESAASAPDRVATTFPPKRVSSRGGGGHHGKQHEALDARQRLVRSAGADVAS